MFQLFSTGGPFFVASTDEIEANDGFLTYMGKTCTLRSGYRVERGDSVTTVAPGAFADQAAAQRACDELNCADDGLCHAYAEHAFVGEPGCRLPRDHHGNHG